MTTPKKRKRAPGGGRKAGPYGPTAILRYRLPASMLEAIEARAKARGLSAKDIHVAILAEALSIAPKAPLK